MKYITLLIVLILSISLIIVGCNNKPNDTLPIDNSNNQNTQTVTQDNSKNIANETKNQSTPETTPTNADTSASTTDTQTNTIAPTPSGISLSELNTHDTQSDCWISYKGKVYDLTSFLPIHPGGINKILPYCGTSSEFEAAFTKKHGISQVKRLESQGVFKGNLA